MDSRYDKSCTYQTFLILSHSPRGLQDAIERQSKDLGSRGAAKGLVHAYLSAS